MTVKQREKQIWLITGAARGIGLMLAQKVLAQGDCVVATSRSLDSLVRMLGDESENLLPLAVEIGNETAVCDALKQAVQKFGKLDFIVNNAGYAQQGALEALTDKELRANFDVNVFAPLHVIRHSLPILRKQHSGHFFNISSIVGFQGGYAGWGSYVASKFALAGLTETLAAEAREIGVKATVVYPGPMRTEFLTPQSLAIAEKDIADYKEAKSSLELHLNSLNGKQIGNPEKLADLIITVSQVENPPLHLFAGSVANALAEEKMQTVARNLQTWRELSEQTDFAEEA